MIGIMNDMTPAARFEKLLLDNDRKSDYKFDAIGQSHRPTFTCHLTVEGLPKIKASATDSTKKAAKHKACNMALKLISAGDSGCQWNELDNYLLGWKFEDYDAPVASKSRASDSSNSPEHDNFNFVGALAEFCQKQPATIRIVGPEYKDQDQDPDQPQKDRIFKVDCHMYFVEGDSNRHLCTTGSGSNKKSAKRQAAAEMYRLLQSEGRDLSVKPIMYHKPVQEEGVVADLPVWEYNNNDSSSKDEDDGGDEWGTSECDVVPHETENQSCVQPEDDYWQQLQDLAVNLDLKLEIGDVCVTGDSYKCMLSASSSDSDPRVACGESSDSCEAAKQAAARKLLKIITNA